MIIKARFFCSVLFGFILLLSPSLVFALNNNQENKNEDLENPIDYLKKSDSCKVISDYTNSFDYALKAEMLFKQIGNVDGEILCKIKFAEIYRHAALFQTSEMNLERAKIAINLNRRKVNPSVLMYYYNRKAALFNEYHKMTDSAIYYSKKALQLANPNNNEIKLTSLMELGFSYEIEHNYKKALKYFERAVNLSQNLKDEQIESDALINIARVYNKLGDYENALKACDRGLKLQEIFNSDIARAALYQTKQAIYEKQGDISLAYKNQSLRMFFINQYYKNNTKDKLIELTKHKEINEQNEQLKTIEQVKRNQILLTVIIFLSVLGLTLLLYYTKKIKITNNQLDIYSKENVFLLEEANHRINNNLQIVIFLISNELSKDENKENHTITKILSKIESIALLHRYLYKSKDKQKVDIKDYLLDITRNFETFFKENNIQVEASFNSKIIANDDAMYYGLLLTELYINSIKYAFDVQENKRIELKVYEFNNKLHFDYSDNGEKTIGKVVKPELVINLCNQIQAKFTIETKRGFEIYLEKEL